MVNLFGINVVILPFQLLWCAQVGELFFKIVGQFSRIVVNFSKQGVGLQFQKFVGWCGGVLFKSKEFLHSVLPPPTTMMWRINYYLLLLLIFFIGLLHRRQTEDTAITAVGNRDHQCHLYVVVIYFLVESLLFFFFSSSDFWWRINEKTAADEQPTTTDDDHDDCDDYIYYFLKNDWQSSMRRNYRTKLGLGYDEAKFNYLNNNSQFSCF